MKTLLVLGSTGSIGTQTLDVARRDPGSLRIGGLGAHRSWRELLAQVEEFRPAFVGMGDPEAADELRQRLPPGIHLFSGPEAMEELAASASYDVAVHGIVGAAGLRPSVRVLERGLTLALANKESLVVAGEHLMRLAREHGGTIIPVDSEHSAIFQCLRGENPDRIRRIYLTASGGPFRDLPVEELADVTPERALRHPNWDMGPRITVGSATLMNKTLEVIEAHHLFGLGPDRIQILIHRQSVVHSMVEFVDGSILAQMGPPDMRHPIHYALHHPDRSPSELRGFHPELFRELSFEEPDPERFPALLLGYEAIEQGADAGCVLNAADEVAVQAFLELGIGFQDIYRVNRRVLGRRPGLSGSVDELLEADAVARELARAEIAELAGLSTR